MYTGPWGQHYVEAVQRQGGKATMEDMTRYQPFLEEPLSTTFLGHTVFVPGKSSEDGSQVLEALNLAEELKLNEMGAYDKDPKAFHLLTQIVRKAVADSYTAQYMSQHGMKSSREEHITKAYAKQAASLIAAQNSAPEPGSPHHSDAVVVIDRWGNVAALVHTINTVLWGTTGMVVDGIPISDAAGFQQTRLSGVKPGDPVPVDMTPVIAMTGDKPTLAVASVGASLSPETIRLLVTTLANHLDPLAAMAAPPMLVNAGPFKEGETFMTAPEAIPEGAYDPEFLQLLRESGVRVEEKAKQEVSAIKGTVVLGTIDPQSGVLRSAETPGIFGFSAAY
jgi:gamma-glutamyltranspeptidase/glutathione hydrolase